MNPITFTLQADKLILLALEEDVTNEDITTNSVLKSRTPGTVELIAKEEGILAGLSVFERVFHLLDSRTTIDFYFNDGDSVTPGDKIADISGDMRVLLTGERTALNYLQRMSGIATYTHHMVTLLDGTGIRLLDTRKTSPNMRLFEKYAVTVGGGYNHRYNLSDGILLKDNHISAAGGISEAVAAAKSYAPFVRKIEVEAETPAMAKEAAEAGADIIMLDNMSVEEMQKAIALIDGRAKTECSGNVTKERISTLYHAGVDYISCGALTHSAGILDLSMKNLRYLP